jgi:DNA-binding transcriptional LysR family regulator
LRVGVVESISWHGIVPETFKLFREHQPDVELQLKPLSSIEQVAAIRSGSLDAGFAVVNADPHSELAHFKVSVVHFVLAAPSGHRLAKLKKLRLRDLVDTSFIWFPRRLFPAVYDRLISECNRGGLLAPRIVQEAEHETMLLSLVACRLGVAFVSSSSRWRCPPGVTLLPVADLDIQNTFALMWRKDNNSALLAKLRADVKSLVAQ